MPSITVDDFEMAKTDLLMVHWHPRDRNWWATLGPRDKDVIRFGGIGATPTEALAGLMLELGAARLTRGDA
jgi:hypothetical protein